MISGVGLASAKMIGCFAIPLSISPVMMPPTESPTNTSASFKASVITRALVSDAKRPLYWSRSWRSLEITPL